MLLKKNHIIVLLLLFVIFSCAKRGTIDGGRKDTIAPTLITSYPKNGTTEFKGKEIKLFFNEYIKLKDLNKQLIISPPMKQMPEILPTTASQSITIRLKDTLLANTTYSFNFGQSIEDNNEGNPYKQFKFVFSTGKYIDSLKINGFVKDAFNKTVDNFVTIALYEINNKFTDSIIYKENPRYITNTLDSLKSFQIDNIKTGKYLLIALKDKNNNSKYDTKVDKIGFYKNYITIPNDTVFRLNLFKEATKVKFLKPKQISANRLILPYEGKLKIPKITLKNNEIILPTIVTKFPEKDSLQVWFTPLKTDSLKLSVDKIDFNIKIKNQKKDTLNFNVKQNTNLGLTDDFTIKSSIPLVDIDNSKISLKNKDMGIVAFTTEYDDYNQNLTIKFKKNLLEKYKLRILPGAIKNYLNKLNDSLVYSFTTKNTTDYGNLRLVLKNVKRVPIIIELTDDKGKTIYSEYSIKDTTFNFDLIEPAKYFIRLIYDDNKNKEWDAGNYIQKRVSEEVQYFSKVIDVRSNWDVEQVWDCSQL